jgi:hypothetical protein
MMAVLLGLSAPGALSSNGSSELGAGSIGFRFESRTRLTPLAETDPPVRLATRSSPHSIRLTRTKTKSEGVNQLLRKKITALKGLTSR